MACACSPLRVHRQAYVDCDDRLRHARCRRGAVDLDETRDHRPVLHVEADALRGAGAIIRPQPPAEATLFSTARSVSVLTNSSRKATGSLPIRRAELVNHDLVHRRACAE